MKKTSVRRSMDVGPTDRPAERRRRRRRICIRKAPRRRSRSMGVGGGIGTPTLSPLPNPNFFAPTPAQNQLRSATRPIQPVRPTSAVGFKIITMNIIKQSAPFPSKYQPETVSFDSHWPLEGLSGSLIS